MTSLNGRFLKWFFSIIHINRKGPNILPCGVPKKRGTKFRKYLKRAWRISSTELLPLCYYLRSIRIERGEGTSSLCFDCCQYTLLQTLFQPRKREVSSAFMEVTADWEELRNGSIFFFWHFVASTKERVAAHWGDFFYPYFFTGYILLLFLLWTMIVLRSKSRQASPFLLKGPPPTSSTIQSAKVNWVRLKHSFLAEPSFLVL